MNEKKERIKRCRAVPWPKHKKKITLDTLSLQ